jgi:hypothetical protein
MRRWCKYLQARSFEIQPWNKEEYSYSTVYMQITPIGIKLRKNYFCQLCQNIKIFGKKILDWTIMGGATIIPVVLRLRGMKQNLK